MRIVSPVASIPEIQKTEILSSQASSLVKASAAITAFLGLLGLGSRLFNLPALRGMGVSPLEMKPNMAIGFVLAGLALWLASSKPLSPRHRRWASLLSGLVLFIGVATLIECAFHVDLGIDEFIMKDFSGQADPHPGLMVPASAFNLMVSGLALLLLEWRTQKGWYPAQWISFLIPLAPLQVLIAYGHGTTSLLEVGPYPFFTQMSPHTAVAWLVLCLGLLSVHPESFLMSVLFSRTHSSAAFRRVLPIAVFSPLILAWIANRAERLKFYHPGFGVAFFTLTITVLIVAVVWKNYLRLNQSEREISDALHSRDEFISIASHELKNPLSALRLQVQLATRLKSDSMDEDRQRAIRLVDRLTMLIDDMLDVARIRTGQMVFEFEDVNLSDVIHETLQRHSSMFQEAGCEVEINVDKNLHCMADKLRIEQLLSNLFANAIKYAPKCAVKVEARQEGTSVLLVVKDEGPGIALSKQSKIFERFERAIDSSKTEGLGLGLYICSKIVEAHKGSITVESRPGTGAAFKVKIPIERPKAA